MSNELAIDDLQLPPNFITKVDIARTVLEVERIDLEQTSSNIRQKVSLQQPTNLVISAHLQGLLDLNGIDIADAGQRSALLGALRVVKEKAPVVHMTFAVTADTQSLAELVSWLRTSIHRQALIEVGLQPALVAGVYLRTPNRIHDMSVRTALKDRHGVLVKELEALRGEG